MGCFDPSRACDRSIRGILRGPIFLNSSPVFRLGVFLQTQPTKLTRRETPPPKNTPFYAVGLSTLLGMWLRNKKTGIVLLFLVVFVWAQSVRVETSCPVAVEGLAATGTDGLPTTWANRLPTAGTNG